MTLLGHLEVRGGELAEQLSLEQFTFVLCRVLTVRRFAKDRPRLATRVGK